MNWGRGTRRLWIEWMLIVLVLAAACTWAYREQVLWRLDLALYDVSMSLWQRPPADDVAIVAIDDASLAAHGRWPWSRVSIARLIEQVAAAGPRGVALDLFFTEPDSDPRVDARLAAAIGGLPVSVLATFRGESSGIRSFVPPLPAIASSASRLGHVHVEVDPDAVVRSVYLLEGPERADVPHFALALAQLAGRAPASLPGAGRPDAAATPGYWQRDRWFRVPFSGPPGHVERVSAADVLAGAGLERLRGKLVLVGATAAGLGDAYAVPTSGAGRLMPGVEISAQALDALSSGIDLRDLAPGQAVLIGPLAVLATLLGYLVLRPRGALLATFAVAAVLLGAAALALRHAQVWYPPATAVAAVLLCYPLWSWRRLDASLAFMREALGDLGAEPDLLPIARVPAPPRSRTLADVVQRSIEAVRAANERERVLRRFVVDAISLQADGVVVVDAEDRVVLCNARAQALLGAADGLAGSPAAAAFANLRQGGEPLWQALASPVAGALQQAEARNADGRELLVTAIGCDGGGAGMIGRIFNLTDVSALKAAARAREEAMGFLSHDLRAPQAAILSVLELRRSEPDAFTEAQLVEQIERSVRRTLDLAEAFVTLTRADHLDPAHFRQVDVADVCREMRDEAWPLCRTKSVRCDLRVDTDEAWVAGERALLAAVVLNLLDNAIKHAPPGSAVRLDLRRDGGDWVVSVEDEGPGIAPEDLPRLFERFRRLRPEGRRASAPGAGLGLVIVDTAVRKHGGRIVVRSAPGRGSTFSVHLPASRAPTG